ncbi:hypothetical protein KC343_g8097 [Hortaea werneckii]|uniref:Rhodopsin domain-containing protein n=1 Tax=Hortaea werneckii TaxID=91943 RepID=A0A3M7GA33_HORWE|nr:hypothetical protein KC323_g2485 [Hortaea werneckii]KAI6871778.1 hypothetical protein KC338_g2455 [Hortaea werneckii]KAI7350228.1 hypothetical protein KC320_g5587 [Hortaea werneckii]KAI7571232.1 hypothetical protein KC317_g1796 [Hortaea werneckii]KAI7615209.1 hypothetical protein KC346_g6579 [Hortaea werneckii]
MPTTSPPSTPQEQAAAARQFNIEVFTLLAVGILVTALRTYTRLVSVGWKKIQADDFLALFAILCYSAETALAYSVGNAAHGLANNGLTSAERDALSPENPEYALRELGSKIQLAGWATYGTVLWALKGSLLVYYTRLTANLGRDYEIRIYIGYGWVMISYIIVIFNLFLGCRPLHRYWQINPDPGNVCHPAVSSQIVWVYFALNVATDTYLLSIPLPLLWKAKLKPLRKCALMVLFGGGIFVIACATLRCVLIVKDPINGAQLAGSWAVRETFVALVTTNLPMIYPFFAKFLGPWFSAWLSTVRPTQKTDDMPGMQGELVTIGQSGPSSKGRRSHPITHITYNESEERIVGLHQEASDVEAQSEWSSMKNGGGAQTHIIQREVEVNVVSQERGVRDEEHDWQRQLAAKFPQSPGEGGHFANAIGPEMKPRDAGSGS